MQITEPSVVSVNGLISSRIQSRSLNSLYYFYFLFKKIPLNVNFYVKRQIHIDLIHT